MSHTEQQLKLSPAQETVLEHVTRYRMTVLPALKSLRTFKNWSRKRIASLLREMCRAGHLERGPLYHHQYYFYLPDGHHPRIRSEIRSHTKKRTGPLSETAKIRNYAMLAFCCLNGTCRRRLTHQELESHLPDICRPGLPLNYYVDTARSPPRLGFVRTDTGGRGRWERVANRCGDDLESHLGNPSFHEFIRRNAFELALITALPQKAERIRAFMVNKHGEASGLVRVVVFPELINLIAPPPIRE